MLAPTTSYHLPVPVKQRFSTPAAFPSEEERAARYRQMYASWSTPMRPWPAPIDRIANLAIARVERQARQAPMRRRLKLPRLTDTPRVVPFRGHCLKRLWRWIGQAIP